jgi:FtsP/CotA-like multicopper oxidase with cupredoxin domain
VCLGHLQALVQRALGGESDRSLKFGRGEGMWLFNGRGWDKNDNLGKGKHIEFDDVGQNTVELWTLEAGGGWVHPVHIHLVVSASARLMPRILSTAV